MPITSVVRRTPAIWLGPLIILAVLQYLRLDEPYFSEYALDLTVTATMWALSIAGPVCGALAAWEAGKLRRAGWYQLPHARSTFQLVAAAVAPVTCVGIAAILIAVIFQFVRRGATGLQPIPTPPVVGTACLIMLSLILVGFAAGRWLPATVAAPAVLIVEWCWMALPPSFSTPWVRHLNGQWTGCCSLSSTLSTKAVIGSVAVSLGLIGMALLLLRQHPSRVTILASTLPLIAGFSIGVYFVQGLGSNPGVERDPAELVCGGSQIAVCLWPEHRFRLKTVADEVMRDARVWHSYGLSIPARFTEQPEGSHASHLASFATWPMMSTDDLKLQLARAMVPPVPACAYHPYLENGPRPGFDAEPYLTAWFAETVGLPPSYLENRFDPAVIDTVNRVRTHPIGQQRDWVERNSQAIASCNVPPALGIAE